jgi:hypothetical protein
MNYLKNSVLLFSSLIFLFSNLCIVNKAISQTEQFANPPQIDFSFTKIHYIKDRYRKGTYTLGVRMKEGEPEFQVSEKIYSSLDFLDEFHLNFVADLRKSNIRQIEIDLEIDSNVTVDVLNIIELKFQYLNQLRVNYLNNRGDKIHYFLTPKTKECFGLCCPSDNGFCLEQKEEIAEGIFKKVVSSYPTESECFKNAIKETGIFVSIIKNKIFIEEEEVSLLQMNKILNLKRKKIKEKGRFIVVLKVDKNSTYNSYLNSLTEILKFYFDLRTRISLEKHNQPYNEISKREQKRIRNETPLVIKRFFD